VSFSPDGQTLVSGDEESGVMLWNLELNDLLQRGCDRLSDYLRTHPSSVDKCRENQPNAAWQK
jgi:WD40 repeat protein